MCSRVSVTQGICLIFFNIASWPSSPLRTWIAPCEGGFALSCYVEAFEYSTLDMNDVNFGVTFAATLFNAGVSFTCTVILCRTN